MEYTVRRIAIGSVIRVAFFLYWFVGLMITIVYGIFFLFLSAIAPTALDSEFPGMGRMIGGLGAVAVVVGGFFLSIVYAVVSAIFVAALAALYNMLVRVVGGITFSLAATTGEESAHRPAPLSPSEPSGLGRLDAPEAPGFPRWSPPPPPSADG